MSSSVGYQFSLADEQARRERALRAEAALLRRRLKAVNERLASLGERRSQRPVTQIDRSAGEETLRAHMAELHQALDDAQKSVDAAVDAQWRKQFGHKGTGTTAKAATEQLAELRAKQTEATTRARDAVKRVQVDAQNLVAESLGRCESADLAEVSRLLTQVESCVDVNTARTTMLHLASVVTDSIARRKVTDAREETRASLIALVGEALAEDQERLHPLIMSAEDPAIHTDEVHQAVERADLAQHRSHVVKTATAALRAAGCEIGADFEDLLAGQGEAVAPFTDKRHGYGLLVRLPKDKPQLVAAVVRSSAHTANPDRDVQAQREFCDSQLPGLVETLRADPLLQADQFLAIDPGRRPVSVIPQEQWPHRTVTARRSRPVTIEQERYLGH